MKLIEKLFSYENHYTDGLELVCSICTLKRNIGKRREGDKIDRIHVDFNEAKIFLYRDAYDEVPDEVDFRLVIL